MAISQLDPLISAEKSVGRLGECSTHHGQGGLIRMVAEWVGPWLGEWLMNGVVHWCGSFSIWRTLEDAISHPKKRGMAGEVLELRNTTRWLNHFLNHLVAIELSKSARDSQCGRLEKTVGQ